MFAEAVAVATAVFVEDAERVWVAVESINVEAAVRRLLSFDAISVRPALRSSNFDCEACNLVRGRCSNCMSLETIDAVSRPDDKPDTLNIDESDDPDEDEDVTVPTMIVP